MIVTKIEPVNKTKYKVFIEGEFAFTLYKGELSNFRIKENQELEEAVFLKIKKETVLKRAKLRAMHLLNDMDRTEFELRRKLKQGLYTDDIIDAVLTYVKSFGYLDDYRYAIHYIDVKRQLKSKKEIVASLAKKGVLSNDIETAIEESYTDDGDQEAILKIIKKKKFHICMENREELNKIYAYLARKGFRYDDIRQVVQYYDEKA